MNFEAHYEYEFNINVIISVFQRHIFYYGYEFNINFIINIS